MRKNSLILVGGLVGTIALAFGGSAEAAAVNWTSWTPPFTTGLTTGTATGTLPGGVSVTYTGDVFSTSDVYDWLPASTFSGGTVGNAPPGANGAVLLTGGAGTGTETITFSQPVINPVLAIASLGQTNVLAEFVFTASEPFAIESGGPSNDFGGTSIFAGGSCPANAVCGLEGSGTVQFTGTFTSLTFTNPIFEQYYLFTVGEEGLGTVSSVPEPASLAIFGAALAGLGVIRRRRKVA